MHDYDINILKELRECEKKILEFERLRAKSREVEEKLRESEEKFRKIFLSSPNLIAVLDKNGTFIEANPAMQERLGLNPIGKTLSDVLPKEIAESRLKKVKRVIRNNMPINFEDRIGDREFANKFIPIVLKKERYCLVIAQDITDLRRMNRLLEAINKINQLIVSEKSQKRLFSKTAKLLSGLRDYYSVWIGLIENGEVVQIAFFDGAKVHPERISLSSPCFQEAMELRSVERKKEERRKTCPFYETSSDHSCLILPMIVDDDVIGFIVFHSPYTLPDVEEVGFLEILSKDLALAKKSIDLDLAKRKAYRQIEKNIEEMAFLVDKIRNPLAIIGGTAELYVKDPRVRKDILTGVDRINNVIKRLDRRWLESEGIRKFLKKYI